MSHFCVRLTLGDSVTSEQRVRWFMNGLKSGEVAACDTFQARSP